ncbi:piwi-like protein 3 [Phodopus roborovskii]|uniref:piwi-like protein 3 n=1 Tax=Phodopus roborovskii TaxID=109678 RepID=UPI0021E47142|nr:piwi-like protein 3 [Phodopus roborovskii]
MTLSWRCGPSFGVWGVVRLNDAGEHPRTAKSKELTGRSHGIFQDLVVNTRKGLKHVKDSKRGTEGKVICLQTNHYQVTCDCKIAFKYSINYKPDIKDINIRTNLLLKHQSVLGKCHIFDGNSLLLPHRLEHLEMELVSKTEAGDIVLIRIQLCGELHPNHPDWLRYYNILFRRTLKLLDLEQSDSNLQELQQQLQLSRFEKNEEGGWWCKPVHPLHMPIDEVGVGVDLGGSWVGQPTSSPSSSLPRMSIQRTYNTSILPYENRLTLCADVTHKLFHDKTVHDFILEKSINRKSKMMKKQISEKITGSIVHTRYNNKTHRIDLVNWEMSPKDTFKKFDGSMITFIDYYKEQYNISITDLGQPLLVSFGRWKKGQNLASREPLFLVPQLCYLTGLKHCVSGNRNLMVTLTNRMRLNPEDRREALNTFINSIHTNPSIQDEFLPWSMRFDNNCLHVTGRHLDPATLFQCNDSVVCVLPNNDKKRYEEIKTFLCTQSPTPSQCVLASTLKTTKNLHAIIAKIAQQMNCKMGGALWKVNTGVCRTMFIGIDCFHDIVNRQKSIAALVASTKEDLSMWHSQCLFQDAGQEIVSDLFSCLQAALDSWVTNEKEKPQTVVVYRDGVGDGQLQELLKEEVRQMTYLSSFQSIKLTFIVVKKRINTRFFLEEKQEIKNPHPGTVVDEVLTREEWYDFYIISQPSKNGTVTPTHYNVIYDTKGLTPNQVQNLTYRLCQMYYNLPGFIRVPAPCHYAHKLAYFVGKAIHRKPAQKLSDYLYYL